MSELNNSIEGILEDFVTSDSSTYLNQILAIPDEEFAIVAPLIMGALKQELNNPTTKLSISRALQASNTSIEEIEKAIAALQNTTAEKLKISDEKKDFLIDILLYMYIAYSEYEGKIKYNIQIPVVKDKDTPMPKYQTDGAAGADVYAIEEVTIDPGETKIVSTGLKMEIPEGYAILVQMRSGLAAKTKLRLANATGVVDSDFRGPIGVILENTNPKIKDLVIDEDGKATGVLYGESYTIGKGERIAQLRLVKAPRAIFVETDKLNDTDRGEGGYGSTGK